MTVLLDIVLPVFGIIFAGYAARRCGLLGAESSEALNRFVYYIALPPLLFLFMARAPLHEIARLPFIAAYLLGALLSGGCAMAAARILFGHRDLASTALHGFAACFSNTAYLGIPLFLAAFGPTHTMPAVVATLASNLVLIALTIALIERGQTTRYGRARIARDVAGALLRNPVLVSLLAGLAASATHLSLPAPVERFLDLLAGAAGPSALFALGLSLYGYPLRAGAAETGWLVMLKLGLQPLLTWWLAHRVFSLPPFWADSAVLLSALPAGALVFVIARRYGVCVRRASAVVVLSTTLSVITIAVLLGHFAQP